MSNYFIDTNAKQITFTDNRFYTTEDNQFIPSVTTILQAYPKDAHFYQWLKQVGTEADEIRDEAGRRGSIVHSLTEHFDAGEEVNLLDNGGNIGYKLSEWTMFERYVEFRRCGGMGCANKNCRNQAFDGSLCLKCGQTAATN